MPGTAKPLISMVMIARDEEANVGPCFETFWDHVDEVVLCDTGSVDGTVAAARAFAELRGEPDKLIVGYFDWCDDFAAARNYADSLATGEWLSWSDLDDRVIGGENLRDLAAGAPGSCAGFLFEWHCGDRPGSRPKRDRLFRNGPEARWLYRCAETRALPLQRCIDVPPSTTFWRCWLTIRPTRGALMYLAEGRLIDRDYAAAVGLITRFLDISSGNSGTVCYKQPRRTFRRLMVVSLLRLDRADEAFDVASDAYDEDPEAPEACVSLAEACLAREDWHEAVRWADKALQIGPPRQKGGGPVLPPSDFTWLPYWIKGNALEKLGEPRAIQALEAGLPNCPEPVLEVHIRFLSSLRELVTAVEEAT